MEMMASKALLESIDDCSVNPSSSLYEVLVEKGMNWTVEQKPVYTDIGRVPNVVANYRSDNNGYLGLVSESHYKIINNVEAFNFIEDLKGNNIFTIENAGMVNDGKKVFVVGKGNFEFELDTNDLVKQYITFVHGHDGKEAIKVFITPIRMVCTNQLNLIQKNSSYKYSFKHSGNIEFKMEQARNIIDDAYSYMISLQNDLKKLINTPLNIEFSVFMERLIGTKDSISTVRKENTYDMTYDTIENIWKNKEDNQNYRSTNYGLLNAVADFISHQSPMRNSDNANTFINKFLSISDNNEMLNKAYNILIAA